VVQNGSKGASISGQEFIVSESEFRDNGNQGLSLRKLVTAAVTNTTFVGNSGHAAFLNFDDGRFVANSGNTGIGGDLAVIGLRGTLTGTTDLNPNDSLPYNFDDLTILEDAALTLRPGVVVKERLTYDDQDTRPALTVQGDLSALGTADDEVVITSIKDDTYSGDSNGDGSATVPKGGDWSAIIVKSTGSANLTHTQVLYGGDDFRTCDYTCSWHKRGAIQLGGGRLSLDHTTVGYAYRDGIKGNGSSLSIVDSTIIGNGRHGVSTAGAAIKGSDVLDNGSHGIHNTDKSGIIQAENNWWGSDSGPAPYGSGNGINYDTSCSNGVCTIIPYVDVQPWIGRENYYGQDAPNVAYEADPVNTANGNYAYEQTDLSISTRGLPLDFTRAYNSLSLESGPLGYGWRHNWMVTAEESGDDVYVTYGNGRQIRFTWNGSNYEPAPGVFSTLTKTAGVFHLTKKNQTIYHFDAQGRLDSIEDKNGNTTSLTYDTQNRLSNVIGPASRTLTFTYQSPVSNTLLSRVTDPVGRTLGFTYNITGELTVATDTRGYTTTYTYDGEHRLLSITDAKGHTFVTNQYNDAGRVVKQWDGKGNQWTFAYDEPDHNTIVTDPLGRTTTYDYDDQLRLVKETDALNNTSSYAYDADNNRIQITDKRGHTTRYAYDDRGNTTIVTDALGYTRTFTYDAQNNPTRETDKLGHTTVYTYNSNGNLIARQDALGNVAHWAYDAYGQVVSQTDALSRTTRYAYDAYGHQTAITDTLGNATTFTYDIVGRKLSETNAKGRTITYTYDAANHMLTVNEPLGKVTAYAYDAVGNRTVITNPRGGVTTRTYDEKDRLIVVTDPLSHTTRYGYDAVDNKTVITSPLGYATHYSYDALNRRTVITDPLGNATTYAYDPNGNRTLVTDANHNTTHYTYDALDRLISVTDAEGGTVTYAYDATGNRVSMTDANGHTTTYGHDALDRLVSVTNPLTHTTVYTYDAVGNRVAEQKPDGTVITQTYDALDRLVAIDAPDLSVGYSYDALDNRTVMTDATGVTTYTYDVLNRMTQVSAPTGTLQYDYDLNGNRTHLTYPDGEVVTYTYDLADRLLSVTDHAARTTQYAYDAGDRQTVITYPNGVQAAYTYDDADRLLNIVHDSPVSGTIAAFTYTVDAVGNRLAMTDTNGVTTYTYDSLYRLTEVAYPDGEQVTYIYDPMGNRTAMTSTVSGVVTYTYDAADRLLTAGSDIFGWDANGRMITRTYGANSATYAYDSLDRLSQVVSGTATAAFTYNGDGVRVGKSVNGLSTDYVQDTSQELPVVVAETTGGQTSLYVYGNDLTTRIDSAGNPSFYHYDALGSVRALSNLASQQTDAYSYDVFGSVRSHAGSAEQAFAFTGEQADSELGLVYLRARYYDPALGRFLSRDHFAGYRTSTSSLNRFIYVQNNPVRLTDPSGNKSVKSIWNDHISPYGQKAIDYGVTAAEYGSTYLKLTGQGLSSLAQNLDTASQVGGAYKWSKDLYEFAEQGTRDEDLYWAYRCAKSSDPDSMPSREDIRMIRQAGIHNVSGAKVRALRDLGMGTEGFYVPSLINRLFPRKWRTPQSDREYQQWLQEYWQKDADTDSVQGTYDYGGGITWSSPPSSGK
jgi:RHS repeat-associated protein